MASTGTLDRSEVGRVGRRIAHLRRRHEGRIVAQEEFAGRLGISTSYLRKIEQGGRDIPLGLLLRAARELNVDPVELIRPERHAPGLEEVEVPLMRVLARLRRHPEGIPTLVKFLESLRHMIDGK